MLDSFYWCLLDHPLQNIWCWDKEMMGRLSWCTLGLQLNHFLATNLIAIAILLMCRMHNPVLLKSSLLVILENSCCLNQNVLNLTITVVAFLLMISSNQLVCIHEVLVLLIWIGKILNVHLLSSCLIFVIASVKMFRGDNSLNLNPFAAWTSLTLVVAEWCDPEVQLNYVVLLWTKPIKRHKSNLIYNCRKKELSILIRAWPVVTLYTHNTCLICPWLSCLSIPFWLYRINTFNCVCPDLGLPECKKDLYYSLLPCLWYFILLSSIIIIWSFFYYDVCAHMEMSVEHPRSTSLGPIISQQDYLLKFSF